MRTGNKFTPWLFSLPALTVYIIIVLVPVIWTLGLSTVDWNGITKMSFTGLSNYRKMFKDPTFKAAVLNNLRFTLISTAYQYIIGLCMAILLNSITRGKNILKVIYFIPCIIATVALSQIFIKLLALEPKGVFNVVISALGFTPKSFLGNPSTSLVTLAVVDGYKYCGIYMVIFYSALVAVSQDVVEAAYIDGCGWFQQYRYIKIPMIRGVSTVVLVMLINGTLKSFEMPYILTNGGPGTSSEMAATYMYKSAFSSMRYGYSSAIAVFLLCECLIAVTLLRKFMPKGESE